MLMAALRLNIPVVFVSGGPMEAGKVVWATGEVQALDLVDAMVAAADERVSDADVATIERAACPTCGSCSGMFTANSMNCLTEALGLSLPGNGSVLATHARTASACSGKPGALVVDLCEPLVRARRRLGAAPRHRHPLSVRERHESRYRHGRLDQHGAAPAWPPRTKARSISPWPTSTASAAACPCSARWLPPRPTCTWRTCTAPAASWPSWASSPAPSFWTPPTCPPSTQRPAG